MHIVAIHAKHHTFIPGDSSAAKMPFPVATMRWAIVASSFFCSVEKAGNWCVMLGKEQKKKDVIYRTSLGYSLPSVNICPDCWTLVQRNSSHWTNESRVQSSLLNLTILQFSLQMCAKRFTHLCNIVKSCTNVYFIHCTYARLLPHFAVNENALHTAKCLHSPRR